MRNLEHGADFTPNLFGTPSKMCSNTEDESGGHVCYSTTTPLVGHPKDLLVGADHSPEWVNGLSIARCPIFRGSWSLQAFGADMAAHFLRCQVRRVLVGRVRMCHGVLVMVELKHTHVSTGETSLRIGFHRILHLGERCSFSHPLRP